jgi:chromosome segregation ATPase
MRKGHRAIVIGLLLAGAAALGRVSAQAPLVAQSSPGTETAGQDVLPALLAEVRGLRAAMEQMASAGPRVQLFVGRLQLQEARINGMVRRLDAVRDSLAPVKEEYEAATRDLQRIQAGAYANVQREEIEQLITQRTRAAASAKVTLDRLTAEEAQLANDLTAEQGRWIEINSRLDDLERALVRR